MEEARILMLTIFVCCITLLFVSILTGHQLFTSLRKKHAEYYEAIGRPIAILPPAVLPSVAIIIQVLKTTLFLNSLLFKGIPKEFPKDAGLVKLAKLNRIILLATYVMALALLISGYRLWLIEKS